MKRTKMPKIKKNEEMTYQKFIEFVEWGAEYFFYYHDEEYWISQNKDGYYLSSEHNVQEFKTTEELFQNGRVENKSLFDVWEDIKEYI